MSQLEIARLYVKTITEIYDTINDTKQMITEKKTIKRIRCKIKNNDEHMTFHKTKNNINNNKFCIYHNYKTHGTKECRNPRKVSDKEKKLNHAIEEIRSDNITLDFEIKLRCKKECRALMALGSHKTL